MKNFINKIIKKIKPSSSEDLLIGGLLIIAALAHGWNMFHYPYFENDEATYISQAWAFIQEGKLSPYTYYYDHAPLGWMFLGLWFLLTGGLTTFGDNPIISGRLFIFILHIFSVLFLYAITKRVTRQKLAATIAVIVFSLSPLELHFGRRVLLDNIMVFWLLLSLFFATHTPQRLRDVILSAFAFAIAILTKENAIFMAPAIVYIIWIYSRAKIRAWSIALWISLSGLLVMLYPLYAFLKGELFPAGTFLGGTNEHVSLIETALYQNSRGNFSFPWEHQSYFYNSLQEWIQRDPFIIIGGGICVLASIILSERYREIKAIALTAIAEILFLARGKLILDFYVIAILPLLAISIGIMLARPLAWAKEHISPSGYAITISIVLILMFIQLGTPAFTRDETTNQQQAINWIEKNVPKDASIAIDNYAYPQLHDVYGYKNINYVFRIQYDPAILQNKYQNNIENIDYLLLTHEVVVQMHQNQLPFIKSAFNKSDVTAEFLDGTSSYIDLNKLISTNGDWAQIYKIDSSKTGILTDSWRSYKKNFITISGQVIDSSNGNTTSEGQSYALLRSIDMKDQVEFNRVWKWTQKNLQKRKDDSLFIWKVPVLQQPGTQPTDTNTASDADQDIAYALIKAYLTWGNKQHLSDAQTILNDIWDKEVISRNGQLYLVSGADYSTSDYQSTNNLLINPSYLAPHQYKIFAQIDKKHNWTKLSDDSYTLLAKIQSSSKANLIPNWIAIKPDGTLTSASDFGVLSPDSLSYDAFRVSWRMANDLSDPRAQSILAKLNAFYQSEWTKNRMISSGYDMEGKPLSHFSDIPTSAGAVISLHALNQNLSKDIYKSEIMNRFHKDENYWGQKTNYYSQNWAWFATQIINDKTKQITPQATSSASLKINNNKNMHLSN